MANDILKTLQAMESELAAIKTAKEQVEAVIARYCNQFESGKLCKCPFWSFQQIEFDKR